MNGAHAASSWPVFARCGHQLRRRGRPRNCCTPPATGSRLIGVTPGARRNARGRLGHRGADPGPGRRSTPGPVPAALRHGQGPRARRQHVNAIRLRHGIRYPEVTRWTKEHSRWLHRQHFKEPALQFTYEADVEQAELVAGHLAHRQTGHHHRRCLPIQGHA
jgi:hypothetical protein